MRTDGSDQCSVYHPGGVASGERHRRGSACERLLRRKSVFPGGAYRHAQTALLEHRPVPSFWGNVQSAGTSLCTDLLPCLLPEKGAPGHEFTGMETVLTTRFFQGSTRLSGTALPPLLRKPSSSGERHAPVRGRRREDDQILFEAGRRLGKDATLPSGRRIVFQSVLCNLLRMLQFF